MRNLELAARLDVVAIENWRRQGGDVCIKAQQHLERTREMQEQERIKTELATAQQTIKTLTEQLDKIPQFVEIAAEVEM